MVFPMCWITLSMIRNHTLAIRHLNDPNESFILCKCSMFSHEKNVIKILYKNNTLERSTPIIWAIMMMIDIIGIVLWKKISCEIKVPHTQIYVYSTLYVISCCAHLLIKNTLHYSKHKIAATSAFHIQQYPMLSRIIIVIILLS